MQIAIVLGLLIATGAAIALHHYGMAHIERRIAAWLLLDAEGWESRWYAKLTKRDAVDRACGLRGYGVETSSVSWPTIPRITEADRVRAAKERG